MHTMKWFRFLIRVVGALLFLGVLLITILTTRPDTTPYRQSEYYRQWKQEMKAISPFPSETDTLLQAGWAKVNITPAHPGPMAGYGKRKGKPYETVHDSVFVRAIRLENGGVKTVIVSADLLIIPPTVSEKLKTLLTPSDIPYEHIYLGATHTHNSVGGWGQGISALFFSGPYDPAVEDTLAEAILAAIRNAGNRMQPVRLSYEEVVDTVDINNRLIGSQGTVDPEIRTVRFRTSGNEEAILTTYAAHSTVLNASTMQLSRDWPGVLVDSLEKTPGTFALYMAGAVGSMSPNEAGTDDFDEVNNQATGVLSALRTEPAVNESFPFPRLRSLTLPLPLGAPAPRVTQKMALRPWVFKKAFGDAPLTIKALRLGKVLLVGVPCDFSGELMAPIDDYARQQGLHLIVTSFNGGYAGYITHDRWYHLEAYETQTMNWYGAHKGAYFQEVIRDLTDLLQ